MKKIFFRMGAMLLLFGMVAFSGCAGASAKDNRSVVCTIFAEYDWVREVLGEEEERFSITLLQDSGVDMHSYQPSVSDIAAISTCDLFIYVGGESDTWVDGALSNVQNGQQQTISLMEELEGRLLEEEELEGTDHADEEEHEHEQDEHVWLSLSNAQLAVRSIAKALGAIDPDYASVYAANADTYCAQLAALDAEYAATAEAAVYDAVVFGDRFPFLYLMNDYGLRYYAAFSGCSAESEASFETIVFLAGKVDEYALPAILTIEGSASNIAQTIRDNTASKDQAILSMDSLQAVNRQSIADGATYLAAMQSNLVVLSKALGVEIG